jgi:hypothetical protein
MVNKGDIIDGKNYADVIIILRTEELASSGVVKHNDAIRFLRDWFGN